ncbi:hypothetical protein HYW36_01230 [Candidatus Saccharibacteria bacterium]|nr:hypothetical protein [Candidatus Saccharibacteria bacterium]
MSETAANYGDVEAVKYADGAHHLYQADPETGKRRHIESDEFLAGMGYEPATAEYTRQATPATSGDAPSVNIPVVEAPTGLSEAALPAVAEGAASAREVDQEMAAQVDALSMRLDEILPAREHVEQTISEKFDQLEERLNRRFEELSRRLQEMETELAAQRGETRAYPSAEPSEAATRVMASTTAENGDGQRELGNRIGDPGQAEVRGQNQEGQPFIYRRRADGQWEVSRNGDQASEWFPATADDMLGDLGIVSASVITPERPAASGPTKLPRSEEARSQPAAEQPSEEVEEVDAEAMDEALGAAWAAMESGRSSYDEARGHLRRAMEIWGGQASRAGGGTPPAAEAGGPVSPESAGVTQERRSRLRRHGRRAIGALLVAGGLVGAFFLGRHFGYDIVPGQGGSGQPGEGARKAAEGAGKFRTEELRYYGDTIWAHGKATLTQAMGGKTPKDWQIWEWARQTMELKGNKENILNSQGHWRSTWEGARHLPVGFQFRISEAVTRAIARG